MARKVGIGMIVLAVVLAAAGFVLWTKRDDLLADPAADQARIAGTSTDLAAAGTARIAFTAQLTGNHDAQLAGTTSIAFSADPISSSDATWTSTYVPPATGPQSLQATVQHKGHSFLISSPKLAVNAKTPFVDPDRTTIIWPTPLIDPFLGFTDFTLWQQKLHDEASTKPINIRTHDLPDVAGAKYEYKIPCTWGCPLPFGTDLDQMASQVSDPFLLSAWYGEDGRLRRLDVSGGVIWGGDPVDPQGLYPRFVNPETFSISFTLSDFGTPVTVTDPPAGQIADDKLGIKMTAG